MSCCASEFFFLALKLMSIGIIQGVSVSRWDAGREKGLSDLINLL